MQGYSLLIVDDDALDRRLYKKSLAQVETETFEIEEAADGAAGLRALQARKFDCILLDFSLPDMTGFEFLEAARVDGELPCAVVLSTGRGSEAVAVEAMKHGVQDYLIKDRISVTGLRGALTQAIKHAEMHQRLQDTLRHLTASNEALEREAAIREATEADLRTAKEAAEKANQAKTRFVAMVTHELRTPLNGILGYAQLLRIEGGLTSRQDQHVTAMMQAGKHLLGMIECVLDFASIENSRFELHPTRVSVRDLIDTCIAVISPMAVDSGLDLRLVTAHNAPRDIFADPSRVRQVLLNLLSNAVKFTDKGGVELRVLPGDTLGALRIEVADSGRGIDEVDRGRLFQDFERLDAATSVQGTGLGLAIAGRIVALMGGTISHHPNPGGGSVFWFELPADTVGLAETLPPAEVVSRRPGHLLLLVDDLKINLDIIGSFLDAAGHSVIMARGGREAVQLASEQSFDLILMDVRMPEIDGLEAVRLIRKLPGPRGRVPILALTAYTSEELVAECAAVGMDGHITKPVDYGTLIRAIDDVIAHRKVAIGPSVAQLTLPAGEGAG
jgi:signal transduction histidine kinase